MSTNATKYAPELTFAQWKSLTVKERALRRAAYYCDKDKLAEDYPYKNRGDELDQWQREAGAALGSPWCGVFVAVNFLRSGADRKKLPANLAWTHGWLEWARQTGRLTKTPKRGDVFVIVHSPMTGHMGHVVGDKDGDGRFESIEGNTNDDGSREGKETQRKERAPGGKTYFIRMDDVE